MKTPKATDVYPIAVAVVLGLLSFCSNIPQEHIVEASIIIPPPMPTSTPSVPKDILSQAQRAWLDKLEHCESSGNPKAINPQDVDGTKSYGLLQFKPGTFNYFSDKYGIKGTLMQPEAQRHIVEQMIIRNDVNWHQQFPDCVHRLGLPPR